MKTVRFAEIRNEFINNLRRNMVIPIIGSGFTRGCKSLKGSVPSGVDYKSYMTKKICETLSLSNDEIMELDKQSFSKISSYYNHAVPLSKRKEYLRDNFSNVVLEDFKQKFLQIDWSYIYTLNIDDGIEQSKTYDWVINSNKAVSIDAFDDHKCLVKLHGDISEMLKYSEWENEVFSQEQYLSSLFKNSSLLSKIQHDSAFQNLLYIGCSLQDEIDLLTYLHVLNPPSEVQGSLSANYICLIEKPGLLEEIDYEKFGITHIVLFDTHKDIYTEIIEAWDESRKIRTDDLESFKVSHIGNNTLSDNFEDNKPYLFFGKSLINENRSITLPYFFISANKRFHNINGFSLYAKLSINSGSPSISFTSHL